MAGVTRYHRLPEDNNRASLDSNGEEERLLSPHNDDDPTHPGKQKTLKYSFHPTVYLRFIAFVLYLSAAIVLLLSRRTLSIPASVFTFIAMGRQIWVLLHHTLTRWIRVRVRIEFRESRSNISTKGPKNNFPVWLLVGFVQVAIDFVLATLVLGLVAAVPHHDTWYYGDTLGAKIVVFVAIALHYLSAADLGQPSRLKFEGKIIFDKYDDEDKEDGNPPRLPVFRDVEATGAGEPGMQSRKTGADSPVII